MNIHKCKMNKPQGFGIDERIYTPVTEFVAQSNRLIHRKGREERKAEHEYLNRSMGKNENNINNELVRTETNFGYSKFGG